MIRRALNVGPFWVAVRTPVVWGKRPPKSWVCVNGRCSDAYGPPRRLNGADCRKCGKGMRRIP